MLNTTELGYPVVSDEIHSTLFGATPRPHATAKQLQTAKNLLEQFGISTPVEYPKGMYSGSLPFPPLKADNIKDHFELVAEAQVGHYKKMADGFSSCELLPLPPNSVLKFQPGWTRYSLSNGEWLSTSVPHPLEEAFVFDTETFVLGGNFPIIGTALSQEAYYVWLSREVVDPSLPQEEWDQYGLVPVGKERFIVAHNAAFDRVRSQEGYTLENNKPESFWFDTLSAHIGVSGLAANQRWLYVLSGKDPDQLTEEEKRKLRYAPKWLDKGATNSLVECYNFHVAAVRKLFNDDVKELGSVDKDVRDIFVTAENMHQINLKLEAAVEYALKDVFYTAELFQSLWPKYIDSTPSMVGLAGHYHLGGSIVPLVPDWEEWVKGTEKVYEQYTQEMTELCISRVWETYNTWKEIVFSAETKEVGLKAAEKWIESDPWNKQLNWEVKSTRGKYAWVPSWVRPFVKDPDTSIGTKSRLAHIMLKLQWKGKPITWIEGDGWCYWSDD